MTRDKHFGKYAHNLLVHALIQYNTIQYNTIQYRIISGESINV